MRDELDEYIAHHFIAIPQIEKPQEPAPKVEPPKLELKIDVEKPAT